MKSKGNVGEEITLTLTNHTDITLWQLYHEYTNNRKFTKLYKTITISGELRGHFVFGVLYLLNMNVSVRSEKTSLGIHLKSRAC